MTIRSNRWRGLLACAAMLAMSAAAAAAADAPSYPSRPVRILVGGAPGSVPDVLVRPIAERLAAALGQPALVENRPGAGGIVAMDALAHAAPDGYTLALATMSQAVFNSYLFAKLPYDPLRDLQPVAVLGTGAMALAAHPDFAARSMRDLVGLAKAQPGRTFVAVPANGSPPHVVGLLLQRAAGIELTMVPHKSGQEALTAALSGAIPLFLDAPTLVAPQVQAGRLHALVVTGAIREPALPDVPTARELGLDIEGEAWIGIVAPAGTPAAIVQRLNREIRAIVATADMRAQLARLSFRAVDLGADEYEALIRADHVKWGTVIRAANLRLD